MLEALVKLINYLDHIVERQLGFPLRDRTRFPNSTARVIYPAILTRKHREWTKRQEQTRGGQL